MMWFVAQIVTYPWMRTMEVGEVDDAEHGTELTKELNDWLEYLIWCFFR